jgi:hypothetical protein
MVNKKRKFSWNTKMEKGLYNGFPSPVYDYEVVEGGENDMVVKEIRQWLRDFNNFCAFQLHSDHAQITSFLLDE